MLNQLVESNYVANPRKRSLLLGALVIMSISLLTSWTISLFGKDFGMGEGDLSLTALVAPVPVPEEEPPPPEPEKPKEQKKEPDVDVRTELIQDINKSPVRPPDVTSTEKNKVPPMRDDRWTKIGDTNSDTGTRIEGPARIVESGSTTGGGLSTNAPPAKEDRDDSPPPPPKPTPAPTPKPVPKVVSGGVMNGKATSLPKPPYPPLARNVRAGGPVTVQILIDEDGKVVSASAVSGHPLLRATAENAARGARFSPTLLSGQPVKVSGVITYNFVP